MFRFSKKPLDLFQSGCTTLYLYQQCTNVPVNILISVWLCQAFRFSTLGRVYKGISLWFYFALPNDD